ncbi:MAG: helix-turn-helix domain-containing protein [Clostridia bacterium]|nr:helix-turn-helix domain-containing protein [Clostridia bacterium]
MIYRLKELRLEFGATQQQLSKVLNIKQNTYSQYENGSRQIPIDVLIKLAKYYEVSVDYLLNLTDIDTPYPSK